MKISSAALAVSVLVNLGFLAAIFTRYDSAATPKADSSSRASLPRSPGTAAPTAGVSPGGVRTPGPDAGVWSQLRTEDLPELVRRLKAAGFSSQAIRAIVYDLVDQRFRPRFDELLTQQRQREVPYWKSPNQAVRDPKNAEALNQLVEEQNALMKQLLGAAYWEYGESNPSLLERRYGPLSPPKIAGLQAIVSDYQELSMKVMRESGKRGGPTSPEDGQKLIALQKEQQADIAKLLTPDELFEYELRNSGEASWLLSQTKIFQPTEAEFRALFPIYRAAGESVRGQMTTQPLDRAAIQRAAEEQMQAKIKEALGPERYADYVQAKDPASEKLNRIVQRLDLPLSVATTVTAVQKEVTQRADAVKADRSLTAEQRQAQLSALAEDASKRITATLGPRGFGAYQQYSGKWLQSLQPKPAGRKP